MTLRAVGSELTRSEYSTKLRPPPLRWVQALWVRLVLLAKPLSRRRRKVRQAWMLRCGRTRAAMMLRMMFSTFEYPGIAMAPRSSYPIKRGT